MITNDILLTQIEILFLMREIYIECANRIQAYIEIIT